MKKFNESQIKVLESNVDRLLVSASAGSGKTTVMIQKIIGLVNSGESLRNMLVSTFTKASAADIKSKLYDGLFHLRDNPHIKDEMSRLPLCDITNLHSWCQRQISQYFYRLGIDPDFSVIDEAEASAIMDLCLAEVIEEETKGGAADYLLLYEILLSGRKDNALKNYVKQIYNFAMQKADPDSFLKSCESTSLSCGLKEKAEKSFEDKKGRLVKRIRELERLTIEAGFIRNLKYIEELENYIHGLTDSLSVPSGKIASEYRELNFAFIEIKDDAKEYVRQKQEFSDMNFAFEPDENAVVLARMAVRLRELYTSAKNEKSYLDFSDLEHGMMRLLEESDVALELSQKYKYIFVDEYQDINPLQEAILNKVCSLGRVFYVGDIKQSIYAFRGCEPGIFLSKFDAYQDKGRIAERTEEVIKLNENYRSDARILELNNDLFKVVMTKEFGGIDYGRDGIFKPGKGNIGFRPELLIVKDKEKRDNSFTEIYSVKHHEDYEKGSLLDAELNLVVHKVLELMQKSVEENGITRPVCLSDIVILVRSAGEYVTALKAKLKDAGIDVSLLEKLDFSSQQITAVLLEFLALIDNFDNDIALVALLRSFFGGFSDEELTKIRACDKASEHFYEAVKSYNKNDDIKAKLESFFKMLKNYHSMSLYLSCDALLDKIVSDFDYFKYAFGLTSGKDKAALLESFLKFAEASPYKKSISGFLRHIKNGVSSESGKSVTNAVRIMTVHSSKGLEFPFVIFANCSKRFNLTDSFDKIILDKEYGICIKRFDDETHTAEKSPAWLVACQTLKRTMLEEELRILYVALTRAVYGLYIFASIDEDEKTLKLYQTGENLVDYTEANTYFTWLLPLIKDYAAFYSISDCMPEAGRSVIRGRIPYFTEKDGNLVDRIRRRMDFRYPYGHAIRKTFVTAALKLGTEEEKSTAVYFSGDDRALKKGSAYHKTMELIDFFKEFDSEFYKLDNEISELVDVEEIKCAVSKMKELIGENKVYKEIPFILNCPLNQIDGGSSEEKVLIQGVIDLLYIEDGCAVIIDYKTGREQGLQSTEYQKQLSIYSKAVEDIIKIPVKKALLYSFTAKKFFEVAVKQ